jgi:hypothetical protein
MGRAEGTRTAVGAAAGAIKLGVTLRADGERVGIAELRPLEIDGTAPRATPPSAAALRPIV